MSCRSISISTGLFCWSLSIEIGHFLTYIYVVQITRPRIWRSKASRPSFYLAIISICTRYVYSEDSFTLSCAVLPFSHCLLLARSLARSCSLALSLFLSPVLFLALSLAFCLARAHSRAKTRARLRAHTRTCSFPLSRLLP